MMRVVKLFGVFIILCVCTQALPMGCSEDAHCPSGFHCDVSQLFCRECLRCEDLKRLPPSTLATCVASATECGPCFSGLVLGIDNHCVPSDSVKPLLPYEWDVIAVLLFLAILVCAAAAYVLSNFKTFKMSASRMLVHSADDIVPASAPQPPPYDEVAALPLATHCEESLPFIKPIFSPHSNATRESVGNQTARVFNNPSYVRNIQPSYEIHEEQDVLPTIEENTSDNEQNVSANSVVSETEGLTTNVLTLGSPTKLLRIGEDSNNRNDQVPTTQQYNNNRAGTAFVINIIENVNTVQQQNAL